MIVILSGEGKSDLGQCKNAQGICSGDDYQLGPMAVLVDQMLEQRLGYSLRIIPEAFQYISESALEDREEQRKNENRKVSLVGKKREQETGYFYTNAWMIGETALEKEVSCGDKVVAILFHDCDGSRSAKSGLWDSKWKSMIDGFKRARFSRGVPMLPKPKSEAWLICAAKKQPYQHCSELEDLSGNDDSPKSAKSQLDTIFGKHKSATALCEWLEENPFDITRASAMPSFNAFKEQLNNVLNEVCST
ncbi:MAG: hypothetical protein WCK96_11545 [Methylococcales bacterium]